MTMISLRRLLQQTNLKIDGMPKKIIYLFLFFICFTLRANAALPIININNLNSILNIGDHTEREKKLIGFIKSCIEASHSDSLVATKNNLNKLFAGLHVENADAFAYFTEAMYQRKLKHMDEAEAAIIQAIKMAGKNDDHFLMYSFLSHLAFIQTDEGNAIEAVTNYGLAKKEAQHLKDPQLQMQLNVNMSDVYYKNNFYNQSLSYLNQAGELAQKFAPGDEHIYKLIYYNKAENFFRMNKPDSLKLYHDKLLTIKDNIYKLYTYQKRTEYYLYLLQYDFKKATHLIKSLQTDTLYNYNDQDQQNLADAYFNGGKPDSAVTIFNELLEEPLELNHPEIKYHLYKVLGQIAEGRHDQQKAALNFKLSLEQAEAMLNRLTQVGTLSSQIKIDEIEGSYLQKDESYKRERIWMIFAVVVSFLIVIILTMFHQSGKQKRHFQKLLFTAQKEELAFINSHEVRKHLSNIMGIIDVIKQSDDREKEYALFEEHLFCSAISMDMAIKNISAKLDEQIPDTADFAIVSASTTEADKRFENLKPTEVLS